MNAGSRAAEDVLSKNYWLDARRRSRVTPRVPEKILQAMTINKFSAVILVLVSSLLLSSCADLLISQLNGHDIFIAPLIDLQDCGVSYHPISLLPAGYRRPGSGDCTFRRGSELGFAARNGGALDSLQRVACRVALNRRNRRGLVSAALSS